MTPSYARYLSLLAALLLLAVAPPVTAQIDYDSDDNRLIEIDSAAKLNAIRYDLDGNGMTTSSSDSVNYAANGDGFPSPSSTQCPTSCLGYELTADIDLSSYANWVPIGTDAARFATQLDGNGHTIANLTIGTAVSGSTADKAGLFGMMDTTGSILRVGVTGANVYGGAASSQELGILVGESRGTIRFSYVTGQVTSAASGRFHKTGGLVGHLREGGSISASYSTAAVNGPTVAANAQVTGGLVGQTGGTANTNTGTITAAYASGGVSATTTATNGYLGGLVGYNFRGNINQSYAYGNVSGTLTTTYSGGLVGRTESWGTETDSYYDSTTSGQSDTGKGVGHPTANLQGPLNYGSGIYASWDTNVDGVAGNDDPWDFGTASQYPVLKIDFNEDGTASAYEFGVQGRSAPPRTDYDQNDNRLIEIRTLAQLNAIRHDLDGNGDATHADYIDAFPNRDTTTATRMGCPAGMACQGYELMADLNFDENGDGTVDAADHGGAYHNGGAGWLPIGPTRLSQYAARFNGNGHTIAHLTFNRPGYPAGDRLGLFRGLSGNGRIEHIGLINANVSGNSAVGILVGRSTGVIHGVYTTGRANSVQRTGGIAGELDQTSARLSASYSTATVTASSGRGGVLVGEMLGRSRVLASYSAGNTGSGGAIGGLVGYMGSTGTNVHASYTISTGGGSGGLAGTIQNQGAASATVTDSYYDRERRSFTDSDKGEPKTTAELQEPTGYDGIYEDWNVDLDGVTGGDDPWDFRGPKDYPVLKVDFNRDGTATWEEFGIQWLPQVRGVRAIRTRNSEVSVSWMAATHATGYKVQWKSGDEAYDETQREAVVTDGTTHTLANLAADAVYTVRVIATRTDFDDGSPSDDVLEEHAQVSGVQVTPGEGTLVVSWNAVPLATGYKVQWKSGDEAYDETERQAVVTDGTTYTLANVISNTEYTVRVIATSARLADGAPSDDVSSESTQVSVTPGEGTLVVSWVAVSGATGYKVQWKSGDEDYSSARQVVITDGATTTYTIAGLLGDREYTVRIIPTRAAADDDPLEEMTGMPRVLNTEPVFTEAVDPQTYRKNKAVELTLPAAIDGNGTVTYSLTDLPDGLSFDAETRIISGTPTAVTEKAIYTVTATDEDGDTGEMSFFITVVGNVAPSFGDASVDAQSYMRKQAIESLTLPQASGGDGTLTYALAPDLPDGLTFDAETRMLSGTPLEAIAETTYTLTATDGDGDAATLMFTLSVMADPMPTFGDTTTTVAARGYQHQEIDPVTLPQASGGDGTLTYTLTPDLPEGLTFDAETRIVSGTPLEAMDETTYTLTATDGNGDTVTLMFTLEIPDLIPTFGDTTIAAQSYLVNQRIESLALPQATGGDGTLAYILLPFLPEGLSFDPDTRTISGTPTEATAEATYTFSAIDADGDVASLPFALAVSLPSPDIDGDGNVNFADFILFAGKYGSRIGQDRYDPRCDLNGDGQIDFADFLIFAADFGSTG